MRIARYNCGLKEKSRDRVVYEESADYKKGAAYFATGVVFLFFFAIIALLARSDVVGGKFPSLLFMLGAGFTCFSALHFTRSTVVMDRSAQILTIRRKLGRAEWNVRYPLDTIERFFESSGRGRKPRVRLALELRDGRSKSVTLWMESASLSRDNWLLNRRLLQFQRDAARRTKLPFRVRTAEEKWERTKANAAGAVRRQVRRSIYLLVAFVVVSIASVAFLRTKAAHTFHDSAGDVVLTLCVCLFIALTVQGFFVYIDWQYQKQLEQVDWDQSEEGGAPTRTSLLSLVRQRFL